MALAPGVLRKLISSQVQIAVESSAGVMATHSDEAYRAAGAQIVGTEGWSQAEVVLVVRMPSIEQIQPMRSGSVLAGLLSPHRGVERVEALARQHVTALALEYLPRITRAQPLDALSSQANLAGYKAVILAAERCTKIFPMLMTAAGTIQPAKVLVIGAGVAGLQAIATARRLGAVVSAYDVRPEVKEQVQSVGARFVELPLDTAAAQGAGGYARELTAEQQQKQRELLAQAVIDSDVVITTAAVPGKPAPRLIGAGVVAKMSLGSVIVDLAAESGGNCELTEPGQIVQKHGATLIGLTNVPATVPFHASQVYASNLANLLKLIITPDGQLNIDPADELIAGMLLCHHGQVVHPRMKELIDHA